MSQTYKNFEWIIVDDGSTDDIDEIIKSYQNEDRILIRFIKQENGGKHRAINNGVLHAKGELFYIVDSDDYLTKDSIDIESDVYSDQTFHIYSDSNIFYKYIAPSEIIFCKELNDYYNLVNNVVIDDISIETLTRKVLENKANGKFLFNSLCKEEIVSNLKQTDKDVFYWITWDDMDIYGNTLSIKLSLKGCKLDKNGHLNIDNLGYRKFRYIINSD